MNTRVKVETKDEISRIKTLQKEIEQLKKLFEWQCFHLSIRWE